MQCRIRTIRFTAEISIASMDGRELGAVGPAMIHAAAAVGVTKSSGSGLPMFRIIDLFCGGGGASMGLHRAGFEVVGVDKNPQPSYPFRFIHQDALEADLTGFDAAWASPPCQLYTPMNQGLLQAQGRAKEHPDLVAPIREKLVAWGGNISLKMFPVLLFSTLQCFAARRSGCWFSVIVFLKLHFPCFARRVFTPGKSMTSRICIGLTSVQAELSDAMGMVAAQAIISHYGGRPWGSIG